MTLLRYSLFITFLPVFAYCVYWLSFNKNHTSPVSWVFIGCLGIVLCEIVIYMVAVRTGSIKKLGIAGQEQKPADQ